VKLQIARESPSASRRDVDLVRSRPTFDVLSLNQRAEAKEGTLEPHQTVRVDEGHALQD
jgi:hypothetical protein